MAMSRRHQAPTLEDVARNAGVSTATVSRCLNTPLVVREDTRTRVLDAIERLGYAPNLSAQALAARRTNTVGAVIPTMDSAIFARGIQAFQEELRQHGITLILSSYSYESELEAQQIRTLVARGAEGLLLIGHKRGDDTHRFLAEREVPTVAAWVFDPDAALPSVGFDNFTAMRRMAERVLDYGHRRIGYVGAPVAANDRAEKRLLGARAACRAFGLPEADFLSIETPYSISNGHDACMRLMQDPAPPSVVICGNDVLAAGALLAARKHGLRVPEDLSVTGFDDIELATVSEPELTTVHVPHRAMGRLAAQRLLEVLRGGGALRSAELETEIRIRASLGRAR